MKKVLLILKDTIRSRSSKLVFFSVIIAVLIPIVIFSTSNSFMHAANEESNKIYGYFDNILYKAEETNILEQYKENILSKGFIKVFEKTGIDNINVGYLDDHAMELANVSLISGTFPQNESEVVVCNSIIYKNDLYDLGATIQFQNSEYKIVGIINDYYAVWNRSKENDILFPTVLLHEKAGEKYNSSIQEHILISNSTVFPKDAYEKNNTLISNTNKSNNNESGKYETPAFVVVLTTICSVFLNLYIFTYYFENEKKKLAILMALGLNKNQTVFYSLIKVAILLICAIPMGVLLGYVISCCAIQFFNSVLDLNYEFSFSLKYLLISILLSIVAVSISSVAANIKIKQMSPLDLFRDSNLKSNPNKSSKKTRKNNVFNLAFLELKLHLKESIIIIILVSFSLALFTSLSLYMSTYSSRLSDVQGRMPLTFDYEFMTNQNVSNISYTDETGDIVSVKDTASDDSVYYFKSHNKIIPEKIIEEIRENVSVETVNKYWEVNDIFLLDAPSETDNKYISSFLNDESLSKEISSVFNIKNNTRGIQYLGYPDRDLLNMQSVVTEGTINIDKIRSGEEVILMAPMYEFRQYDGYSEQQFITQSEYTGSDNQYKDSTYSVGDTISFVQFYSDDKDLNGYLDLDQVSNKLKSRICTVRIGAIIYERVAWFDRSSQPPTAYSLIGLNESISNLKILPTTSRLQIFLKNTTTYQDFDPIIRYYQNELSDYSFRNNAAEMQDFKEFQLIVNTLCYSLIAIICLIVMVILYVEDRITVNRNKKFYALLRLNGLNYSKIQKMLLIRACTVGIIGIVFSLIISFAIMIILFGSLSEAFSYINIIDVIIPIAIILITIICSPLLSIKSLKNKYLISYINNQQ